MEPSGKKTICLGFAITASWGLIGVGCVFVSNLAESNTDTPAKDNVLTIKVPPSILPPSI